MKKLIVLLAMAGTAAAFGAPAFDNGVLTYTVAAGDTETEANTFASYGTVTSVVKEGDGTLKLTVSNSSYGGTVDIKAGIVDCAHGHALGSASGTVYVRDGAQLKPTFSSAQGDSYISPPVHIIGEGPDGNGAIRAANGGMGDNMFSKGVILDGPATVGGSTRIGFYLYMNGYTLTDKVSAEHLVRGVNATAPGNIVYSGGYRFVVSGTFSGSSANTLTIAKAGGTVCFWNATANTPWTLLVNENGSIASGAGTDKSRNRWHGPVVIADGKTLSLTHYSSPAAGVAVGVSGPISGNGNLVVTASSYSGLKAYLSGVNTYTGGTTVKNNGTLYAEKDKSIPETGAITLSGGYMNFVADANAWTMTELAKRLANVTGTSGNAVIYTSSGKSATDDVGFTVTSGEGSLIGHGGDGSLVTTGSIAGKPKLYNASGTWTVRSPTLDIHGFNVTAGTLTLDGAGYAWTSNYSSHVGGDATRIGTLIVKDSVVDGKLSLSGSSPGAYTHLGHSVAGARGLLKVEDGGAFTNKLFIGHNAKMCGAVYQTGGNVLMSCNSTADGMWGSGGYGFYDAAGGELGIGHCLNIGGNGTSGTGILRVSGGSAIARGDMFVCSGATGVVHVTGGRLEVTQWLRLGQKEWAEGSARGTGILTIDGPDAVVKVGNVLSLGQRLSPAIGILNINGGALEVVNPIQNSPNNGATTFYTDASQKEGYVNFNGGTLRSMLVDLYLFGTGALTKPTKVTVFAGGAVIDANGHNSFVSAPLEAPSGWGVASIALPQDFVRTDWLGPQHVSILGGSGRGATAITDFDATSGTISRIIVTSPGQGYAEGDTLAVSIPNNHYTSNLVCTATLAPLASGGLTVTNSAATAGTITLNAVNTYTGATVVAAGTLKVGVANAIAASRAALVAPGATLNLNSLGDLSVDSLGGGGMVANGNVTAVGLVFPAATATNSTLTLTGSLTLGANASLTVTDVDEATFPKKSLTLLTANGGITGEIATVKGFEATEHPNLWQVFRVGNSIRLHYASGTAILIR